MSGSPPPYTTTEKDNFFKGELRKLVGQPKIKVTQSARLWETLSLGCCDQNNRYTIKDANDMELFRVLEDSDCMTRICCSPCHTYDLKVVQQGMIEPMPDSPVLVHRAGQTCIGFEKCLCCFSCSESCNNVSEIYSSDLNGQGAFSIEEKVSNGCTAELVINYVSGSGKTPLAVLHGPTFFGGCAELCYDADFFITTCDKMGNITGAVGDVAKLRKLRPSGCISMLKECCTDADNYEIDFNLNCEWTKDPNFLGMVLGGLFTLDFMFFEKDHPYLDCSSDGKCLLITICNFYCYGCICPCQICIPIPQGGE